MSLSLDQALDTSEALEERIGTTKDAGEHERLLQKKAMVDFAAFGLFKEANALATVGKPLAWGLGLGLPALGVGHALLQDARHQGEELVNHTRNQAFLTALGLGGAQTVGELLKGKLSPKQREETNELTLPDNGTIFGRNVIKMSTDGDLQKLAAVLILDNVLVAQLEKAAEAEHVTLKECLFLNRSRGTALLRKLRQ